MAVLIESDAQSSLVNTYLLPVLLDARRTQTSEAVLVDAGLPREKFIGREHITTAGFLKREQPTANCRNYLSLAPDDPAFCTRRGQIGNRQRTAVRPDHVFWPWSNG